MLAISVGFSVGFVIGFSVGCFHFGWFPLVL